MKKQKSYIIFKRFRWEILIGLFLLFVGWYVALYLPIFFNEWYFSYNAIGTIKHWFFKTAIAYAILTQLVIWMVKFGDKHPEEVFIKEIKREIVKR